MTSVTERRIIEVDQPPAFRTDRTETTTARSLFDKLADIMRDTELVTEVGGLIQKLALPSMVAHGKITPEQRLELDIIQGETISSLLTPEEREAAKNESSIAGDEVSEYISIRM